MREKVPAAYFRKFIICLCCCIGLSESILAQPAGEVERIPGGVIVHIRNSLSSIPQSIQLRVITDQIIHVMSSPLRTFSDRKSLILTDTVKQRAGWDMRKGEEELILSTGSLEAKVSLLTGVVSFYDKAGNPVLQEVKRGNDTFTPGTYNGDAFYRIRQGFRSVPGEAYYGLGQHQKGIMNYKGHQVTLLQYNTEVAVPFVISSRNYGILWDNYSITRAGDTRELQPLSGLKLYARDGEEGWLTADYCYKKDPGTPVISRPESEIDYTYLSDICKFPEGFKLEDGLVTWEGFLESPYEGLHQLHFQYAGYIKVWLNGELQEDRWRESWNAGDFELQMDFEKGKRYLLKIAWTPEGGESYLSVKWLPPAPEHLKEVFAFDSEAGDQVDYYFIYGQDMDEVISGYRHLSGRAPVMPRWAFGFWQSRERYKTQEELLSTAKEFRKREIPIDNIVLDWSYWPEDQWGSQDFEQSRFPDPDGMIRELHEDHFHFMISVWPKFYEGIAAYREFDRNGWLYKRNIAEGRRDWIGPGYTSTFYDPFHPGARQGFWDLLHKKLHVKGVDAWWMDASEPDIHSNINLRERKEVMQPAAGSSARYYNAFPLQNAKGIYEGQRAADPDRRVFILTRSSFAGQQRYAAATWSGDIASRWHDMKDQIAAGVNLSMSGIPYWTMDVGGFLVEKRFQDARGDDLEEWRELNVRWYQFGAFLPLFRAHGQYPYREIFHIAPEDHPAYQSILYYNRLRYRLLPYIYSLAGHTYHKNYTMLRGLAMDFAADTAVLDLNDQFILGPSLLVNPVCEYQATERVVYLPGGQGWYDLYTGKYEAGGKQITARAPYERMPVYVREGSILPCGPELQYTFEKPADPLTLYVYAGRDASFELYEDEGTNYNYEKGAYTVIPVHYDETGKTLRIGKRTGSFEGMLRERTFRVVRITSDQPAGFLSEGREVKTIHYDGNPVTLQWP